MSKPSHSSAAVGNRLRIDSCKRSTPGSACLTAGRSNAERWAGWLARAGIPWPRLESGALMLDDDTFREMARSHRRCGLDAGIPGTRSHNSGFEGLAVGSDGRNRTWLSPFGASTGRNTPSNTHFIFGPSTWLRGLIKPEPGMALAYVDWSQQEFGIAAALSGDPAMVEAYQSGDPYLAFGKQAGRIPPNGTKRTHGPERELFKTCILGVQYGMGEQSLAPANRQAGSLCPRPALGSIARPTPILAVVGRGRSPTACFSTSFTPSSAGRSASDLTSTPARSETSHARRTGPR